MPVGKGKSAVSTVLPNEVKEKFQRVANSKKWTLSQTLKEFINEFVDVWLEEMGLEPTDKPNEAPKKPKRSKRDERTT